MISQAPKALSLLGQSLWLDNITRDLLDRGELRELIHTKFITGLTSNPTIFDHAISHSAAYDADIRRHSRDSLGDEDLFFNLAIDDLRRAADMFAPVHARTSGVDGFVSLEVSPLLAQDAPGTVLAAKRLHAQARRANLFIKIPGTKACLPAIEEAIFSGVPVNVTLLFSAEQYVAAADAYLAGLERRYKAGLSTDVRSVASLFVSRWDKAESKTTPAVLRNTLGVAVAELTYKAYRDVLESDRFQRLAGLGARAQRLLFASTGTKDPNASDTLYVAALAAPNTVNTMPPATLQAFADHGEIGRVLERDGDDANAVLSAHAQAGVDIAALASELQVEGALGFAESWSHLIGSIHDKRQSLN
jgi:transaldolase